LGGILPQKQQRASLMLMAFQLREQANLFIDVVQGWTDSWIPGAVRGAEHRRLGGKSPIGARRWIAALAKQYMDVLSEQPRQAEKRRNTPPRMTRGGAPRPAPSLLPTFGQCQKWVARRRRVKALLLKNKNRKIKLDFSFRWSDDKKQSGADTIRTQLEVEDSNVSYARERVQNQ
jgi:hypothetical protein